MDTWMAFTLGLVGSLHCAAMCGPLALALPWGARSGAGFIISRVVYNFGRLLTYCFLGILFGWIGQALFLAGIQRWLSISSGVLLLIGLFGTSKLALKAPVNSFVQWLKSNLSAFLPQRSLFSLLVIGLLNGLLPCGLVYVACAGAAASHGVFSGALCMAAFGLGTLPMMLAIGISGKLIPLSFRLRLRKAIPVSVFLLAALLLLRGLSLGIPYLSPELAAGNPSCCHK